jgi:hypothetical protein
VTFDGWSRCDTEAGRGSKGVHQPFRRAGPITPSAERRRRGLWQSAPGPRTTVPFDTDEPSVNHEGFMVGTMNPLSRGDAVFMAQSDARGLSDPESTMKGSWLEP